jgi:transcriptional regulator with XRE-family HTH domain
MRGALAEEGTTLGQRITAAREAAGFSTAQLARRLGVATRTLAAWERDQSEPRSNRLLMLAGVLNIGVHWLLKGGSNGPRPCNVRHEVAELEREVEIAREHLRSLEHSLNAMAAQIDELARA